MVYLTSSSDLRISVTPNLCDLNRCDLCPWPAFRKVNQLFSDMQDVIRFSLLSVPWQMIWLVEEASQWADRFLDPICFFLGRFIELCCLVRGFSEKNFCGSFSLVTKLLRFQGTFLIADFAANCVKVLNVHHVAPDPLPSRKLLSIHIPRWEKEHHLFQDADW